MLPDQLIPGSRAPLMMDVVALAILLVVPLLTYSLWLAKHRRNYQRHKQMQVIISIALAVVIVAFEIEVRSRSWRQFAAASPYLTTWLDPIFYLHLCVAVATSIIWIVALVTALKRFPSPPRPGPFSASHKTLGGLAALGMYATTITGWTFYWVAFLA